MSFFVFCIFRAAAIVGHYNILSNLPFNFIAKLRSKESYSTQRNRGSSIVVFPENDTLDTVLIANDELENSTFEYEYRKTFECKHE